MGFLANLLHRAEVPFQEVDTKLRQEINTFHAGYETRLADLQAYYDKMITNLHQRELDLHNRVLALEVALHINKGVSPNVAGNPNSDAADQAGTRPESIGGASTGPLPGSDQVGS